MAIAPTGIRKTQSEVDSTRINQHKQPVSVICEFSANGDIKPLAFATPDDSQDPRFPCEQMIKIDRIRSACQAVSLKAGGQGIQYDVSVTLDDVQRSLYLFNDEDCWFIEKD